MQMVGLYLSMFAWLFVVVERAIATVFAGSYEHKCTSHQIAILLCGLIVSLCSIN